MARLKNHGPAYWLNSAAAAAFDRMEDEQGFIDLNSAGRTLAEQQDLINRWDRGGAANRPPYLYSPARPASSSRHVMNGGIAFDTSEWRRVRGFCERYGFRWWGNSDPVHFEYIGGGAAEGSASAGFSQDVKNQQAWLNSARGENLTVDGLYGPATQAAFKRYQEFLRAYGYSGGIDGAWGPGTQAAHQTYYDQVTSGKLTVDGQLGPITVKALQKILGVEEDGKLGPVTVKALQNKLGVTADGELGPISVSALQRLVGANPDGNWGSETTRKLQEFINNGGKFVTITPPPVVGQPSTGKLDEDGILGEATVKALQKILGVTEDGKLGPETISALQKRMGIVADGILGPITIKNMQQNVGAVTDGAWGSETTRKLQQFLNAGKQFVAVTVKEDPVVTYPKPAKPSFDIFTKWDHSPNSSKREGNVIDFFIPHHWGIEPALTSMDAQWNRMMNPNDRKVSANVLVGSNGEAWELVPYKNFRAWTTGSIDHKAFTVETQNEQGAPGWKISDKAHDMNALIFALLHITEGIPLQIGEVGLNNETIKRGLVTHNMTPAGKSTGTFCGSSFNKEYIVERAKQYVKELTEPTEPSKPVEPQPEPETPTVPETPVEGDTVVVKRSLLKAVLTELDGLGIVIKNIIGE